MRSLFLVPLALLAGCADDDTTCFTYAGIGAAATCPPRGLSQPGTNLAEGGEIRHEHVRIFGTEQTWIQLYAFTGPSASASAPLPSPADGGKGPFGNCVDERDPVTSTWPFKPIEGATYVDFPAVPKLTGAGIPTGMLSITKSDPPNVVGNSTYRTYDFTYGGGQPGTATPGFNGTLTAGESVADAHYTLDVGLFPVMDYYLPPAYTPPLDIGGADTVVLPRSGDLVLSWEAPPNNLGDDGVTHTKKTYYAYTVFIDPAAAFPPQFICFPDEEAGHQTIPASVRALLPAEGIVIHAETTHYMEALDAGSGEHRRFDLVGGLLNISHYELQ